MESALKLYMVLLGAMPPGRKTEQHDVFFGIARELGDLKQDMIESWPEAAGTLHIDVWREVTSVDGYEITVNAGPPVGDCTGMKLFFINLGGYKKDEFEEFHYKILTVASGKAGAIARARQTAFHKHTGFKEQNYILMINTELILMMRMPFKKFYPLNTKQNIH